ncbi:MAG TPA: hypothetical protein VMJ92_00305 [Candidatus Limnocylindrales bacterium]|nr:hypothetical protein [Candidatus Limnocylindrales bacterium]
MSVVTQASITDLEDLVEGLAGEVRAIAARILAVSTVTGVLDAPPEMHEWIAKLFGSVEAVREQRIVRVTNRVTYEGAFFNELRARRPMEAKGGAEAQETIAKAAGDPFCLPLTGTPRDVFGRISGTHAMTASNIAKYDGFHGVLVFAEHDPLAAADAAVIRDYLATGRRWAEAALNEDPAARYYFLMWNSLWRAGGSIVHGHMQMTATRGMHYPKIELLRKQALEYDERHHRDYFDDLWAVHDALGLATEMEGARVFASLTPIKEREVVILGRPGEGEVALAPAIARVLASYRRAGVLAFNLACYLPPLSPDGTDWRRFPPVVRMVDRGDPANRTSDIGAMELYAASVISADPFRVSDSLRS